MPKPMHRASRTPPRPRVGKPRTSAGCLDEQTRVEIVTRLAMFDTVKTICLDLRERGIDISAQAISAYNPLNQKPGLAPKWVELFHLTREKYLAGLAEEPLASQRHRLAKLRKLFEKIEDDPDRVDDARKILEQAAKEVGNVYTNVAKVQGAVLPGQIINQPTGIEEMRNMLADRLGEAIEGMKAARRVARAPTEH